MEVRSGDAPEYAARNTAAITEFRVRHAQTVKNDDPVSSELRRLARRVRPGSLAEAAYLIAAGFYATGRSEEAAFAVHYAICFNRFRF